MQDKQGSMLLAHNVVGCLLPFIFFGGVVMMGIMGILGILGILGIGNRHNRPNKKGWRLSVTTCNAKAPAY